MLTGEAGGGAVNLMKTRIRLLAQLKLMRSIIDAAGMRVQEDVSERFSGSGAHYFLLGVN